MFSPVNHPVSDTADFVYIRQDTLLTVFKMSQQGIRRFMMISQRRFVQKSFPPLHLMLKQRVGQANAVRLAMGQDIIGFHLKEFVFER
jgi:hypothetical protein